MRYMAWIQQNMTEPPVKVERMITAREISKDLILATSLLSGVRFFDTRFP